ncbi:hypothetical protein, partial [Mesorhizobium japonicum]|uniref:hypothetical protein n=1 Tax=Mesorhizobium japonicum TaxID=2066070 RepID=UPI003B590428
MKSEDEQFEPRAVNLGGRLRTRHRSGPSGGLRRRFGLLASTALLVIGVGIAPALAVAAPSSPVPSELTTWEPASPPWNTGLYGHGGLTVSSTDFSNFPAVPYYFFGKDASGKYLPKWVALCIDFLHAYHTTGNSTTDLETYLPKQYAQQINQSLAAALQLAEKNGLVIDKSGGQQPLQFTSQDAVNIMFSAQWQAWYIFAKYNYSNPKPSLQMTDFVDNDPKFSPDTYLAQINGLVDEYNQAPAVNGQVIPLTDQTYTSAADPTLSPFNIVVDDANSTANYQDYVTVSVANGQISAVRKKPFSGTINVAFEKVFDTQIDDGSNLYAAIGTPDNEQTKSLLTNAYPSDFSLSFESPSFAPQGVTLVSSQPVVAG